MLLLLLVHVVVAAAASPLHRRLGTRVFWFCALAPGAAVVWLVMNAGELLDDGAITRTVEWVPELGLEMTFRADAFSWLMVVLIAGIGIGVFAYSTSYFHARPDLGRFAAVLTVFAGAMLGLVLADNLLLLYVFWELTSVTSYLLVGFDDRDGSARAAARQALLITAGGGLAMLAGFVLIGQSAGTYSISQIAADPPSDTSTAVGLVLVLIGAFAKSAQMPLHAWLPGAMAAPTPVSAYLHSATMVKAGVYLIARLAPIFAASITVWRPTVEIVGATTLILAGWKALRQTDLKLLLAYGTVSQLGMLVLVLGVGEPELVTAGVALLVAHALFKASLFLVVGAVDHEAGSRDIRELSGLRRAMPVTFGLAVVAVASMAGVVPLAGFVAKEKALDALLHTSVTGGAFLVTAFVVGAAFTFAYGARFLWGAFGDRPDAAHAATAKVHDPPAAMLAPPVVLVALTILGGLFAGMYTSVVEPAATALDPESDGISLVLWPGFHTALYLSLVSIAAGVALFAVRTPFERFQNRIAVGPSPAVVFEQIVRGMTRTAGRITAIVQNGSLPVYLAVILLTLVLAPTVALGSSIDLSTDTPWAESLLQTVVCAFVIIGSVAVARIRRRFAAVLALGATGFAVAVLFVIQGAPDLALTQLLIETLTLVVLVLVFRQLPERFPAVPWRLGRGLRLLVAAGVGVFVTVMAMTAATARRAPPVSNAHLEQAYPEGGGENVVNVILTDFRALDTLGEVAVIAVAAVGIASLVGAGSRIAREVHS
ncbi:MAG: hydrogen gas-evolving membrane-bound hydrogenase subunit E [Actinomycetota bacterium]|nr:hydrogen gas-evolving membrane-bound hydrogenase subunit E [Actinomycetota bacterium]